MRPTKSRKYNRLRKMDCLFWMPLAVLGGKMKYNRKRGQWEGFKVIGWQWAGRTYKRRQDATRAAIREATRPTQGAPR